MFGYSFVTLSDGEVTRRRELLNLYAAIAQFSPIISIVCIHVYRGVRWASQRYYVRVSSYSRLESSQVQEKKNWVSSVVSKLGHVHVWLDERLAIGYTVGEYAFAALWIAWLLFLSTHRTGHDFLHVTRRVGIVGVAQLPLQYLLGRRSVHTALHMLMGLSYERQLVLHRMLGIIVFCFIALHSSLYTYFFVQSDLFLSRIRGMDVAAGVCASVAMVFLTGTSFRFVSHWNYRVFYTVHVLLSTLLVVLLFLHTHHIRKYAVEVLAVRILDELLRHAKTRTFCGTLDLLPGTNLVLVTIPLTTARDSTGFKPGQHVYLGCPPLGRSSTGVVSDVAARFRRNPFTVASLPDRDHRLILVCQARPHGNTSRLSAVARQSTILPDMARCAPLLIEGPYGGKRVAAGLRGCDHVLIVAGGVGATFGLPVFRDLAVARKLEAAECQGGTISLVWAVRNLAEASWAFPEDLSGSEAQPLVGYDKHVTLHVTGSPSGNSLAVADVEMAELTEQQQTQRWAQRCVLKLGRPCLRSIVDDTFNATDGSVAVVVCGPDGMVKQLLESVNSWRTTGRPVFWHAEQFTR